MSTNLGVPDFDLTFVPSNLAILAAKCLILDHPKQGVPEDHYYERWFREIRCKPKIKVIEIGANQGHSLNAWDTIFTSPGKTVLGLAYGGPAMGVEKKVRHGVGVLFGDQSKKKTMASWR